MLGRGRRPSLGVGAEEVIRALLGEEGDAAQAEKPRTRFRDASVGRGLGGNSMFSLASFGLKAQDAMYRVGNQSSIICLAIVSMQVL